MLKNKFLNIMFLSFVIALSLYSKPITLQSGWNLLGTGQDLMLSDINKSCIDIVWTYKSGQWSAFSPQNELQNKIDANSNISSLDEITANSGFWVEANSACNTVTITPTNTAPVANAGADQNVTQGDNVTLDASGSSDSDGTIVSYEWKEGSTVLSTSSSFSKSDFTVGTHTITLTVTDNDGATASDTVVITVNGAVGVVLKKTGQTKSYDANGNEVTDGSLKDDGYYQKGVTPSYTRDDTNDIVTDNLTGLMWQDDAAVATVTKQWLTDANYNTCSNDPSSSACYDTSGDTAATYCSDLTLGGYTDWRLATVSELEGILDYGKVNPSVDTAYFNNVSSGSYWSSTSLEVGKDDAWIVSFDYGNMGDGYKVDNYYVRCVRGGE